ncbi:MAG: gliding motility-associated C-terminal domain-containing protein [Flavobacteriales bacterium]|nr:gliding motility-associated C-terminal domain-containing protein [Flavobacteriales bacterium]
MKNTATYFVLLVLLSPLTGFGQLNNGGFESNTGYPGSTGQWQLVPGWNNAGSASASPDYFHYMGSTLADLPETPVASINPYEGNAVMGLIATGVKFTNTREYLTAVLAQPLEAGKQYHVGFKISNGVTGPLSNGGLGTSDLGLYFSAAQPTQSGQSPLMVTPQCAIDTMLFSRDWVSVNFVLNATADFAFMTFGVFGNDDDKDIVPVEGDHPQYAYYFLDSFYIEEVPENFDPTAQDPDKGDHNDNSNEPEDVEITNVQDFFVPNTFTPNGDGSNDIFLPVSSNVDDFEISIYSRWGKCVFKTNDITKGWDGFYDGKKAEVGTYYWQISYVKANERAELERKEISGVINLLR